MPPVPAAPSRGDIWDVRLEPVEGHEQGGIRPALILSADTFNAGPREMAMIVPLTTRHRAELDSFRVKVERPNGGLSQTSYVIPDQIRALSTRRLVGTSRRGRIPAKQLAEVEDRLRVLLNL